MKSVMGYYVIMCNHNVEVRGVCVVWRVCHVAVCVHNLCHVNRTIGRWRGNTSAQGATHHFIEWLNVHAQVGNHNNDTAIGNSVMVCETMVRCATTTGTISTETLYGRLGYCLY